jgi:hypothetical protein
MERAGGGAPIQVNTDEVEVEIEVESEVERLRRNHGSLMQALRE